MKQILSLLLLTSISNIANTQFISESRKPPQFRVAYEWNLMDYRWPSSDDKFRAVRNSFYIPENNVITGIEFYNDRLFITLPRWRNGVPSTLNWIPAPNQTTETQPLLNPFPSWEMNRLGDCRALQNVQSVEVDLNGVLWVIDGGRTGTMEPNPDTTCPPKLVLFDLNSSNNIIREYIFPNEVALHDGSFLNDLVIDDYNGRFAYITDNSAVDPGLIVYSFSNNTSWKVREARSMQAASEAIQFVINDTTVGASINIDGIALTPASAGPTRDVIFSPLSSFHLYSISTTILRNKDLSTGPMVANYIKDLGYKSSQTDGMIMDEFGTLYYGLLGENAVGTWDTNKPLKTKLIARDSIYLQWPDSFAIDPKGNLYVITNRLQKYLARNIRAHEANYRILVAHIGARSYLYGGSQDYLQGFRGSTLGPEGRSLSPQFKAGVDYQANFYDTSSPGNTILQAGLTPTPSVKIFQNGQEVDFDPSTSTINSLSSQYPNNVSSVCSLSVFSSFIFVLINLVLRAIV